MKTPQEVEEYFPGFMAFMDTTEQQVPRPKDRRRRKIYYSGKKKKHTVKNQYTVNQSGLIIHKTKNKHVGRIHDYNIYKKNHPITPKEVENVFDLGCLGVQKDFPNQISKLRVRKKRNQELVIGKNSTTKIIQRKG